MVLLKKQIVFNCHWIQNIIFLSFESCTMHYQRLLLSILYFDVFRSEKIPFLLHGCRVVTGRRTMQLIIRLVSQTQL